MFKVGISNLPTTFQIIFIIIVTERKTKLPSARAGDAIRGGRERPARANRAKRPGNQPPLQPPARVQLEILEHEPADARARERARQAQRRTPGEDPGGRAEAARLRAYLGRVREPEERIRGRGERVQERGQADGEAEERPDAVPQQDDRDGQELGDAEGQDTQSGGEARRDAERG